MRNLFLPIFILFFCEGCIKEFNPPSQGYENLLVVESLLTGEDPFEVKLSRSIPIDTTGIIPESGAKVMLTAESGESYNLEEYASGIYRYSGDIIAQNGSKYQIHIQTSSGDQYESEQVIMRTTPEIDELKWEFQQKPNGTKGVQFYISTHDDDNDIGYYRWEWEETWIFKTPYDSYLKWEDNRIQPRGENINTCWKFFNSTTIELSSSTNLSRNLISDYPIKFVSTQSDRLKERYSFNVKQYAISEESYNFWTELRKITESLGSLFDPQPSVLKGNIYNINNKDEIVLGYFDATTVAEKRIFIDKRDLPPTQFANNFPYCEDTVAQNLGLWIPAMIEANYMLVGETTNDNGLPAYILSTPSCVDCRLYASNKKPEYWY